MLHRLPLNVLGPVLGLWLFFRFYGWDSVTNRWYIAEIWRRMSSSTELVIGISGVAGLVQMARVFLTAFSVSNLRGYDFATAGVEVPAGLATSVTRVFFLETLALRDLPFFPLIAAGEGSEISTKHTSSGSVFFCTTTADVISSKIWMLACLVSSWAAFLELLVFLVLNWLLEEGVPSLLSLVCLLIDFPGLLGLQLDLGIHLFQLRLLCWCKVQLGRPWVAVRIVFSLLSMLLISNSCFGLVMNSPSPGGTQVLGSLRCLDLANAIRPYCACCLLRFGPTLLTGLWLQSNKMEDCSASWVGPL